MARITTTAPTGEQLALDLFPTADPDLLAVWTPDTRGSADVRMWLERGTKPGTKSTTQWRAVWLNGTRTARTSTWWPTRRRALESLLHNVHMMHRRDEPAAPEVLDRRDVSGLDLELSDGSTTAVQFVHRRGQLVGIITRTGPLWRTETTAGDWHSTPAPSRRVALEDLAAQLEQLPAPTEQEALEAITETADSFTEPEVLRSYSGATVAAEPEQLETLEAAGQLAAATAAKVTEDELHVLRSRAKLTALHLSAAQSRVGTLLDDRARAAYRLAAAGVSHAGIGSDLGVTRQMAAKLITRGLELDGIDVYPEPLAAPPAG